MTPQFLQAATGCTAAAAALYGPLLTEACVAYEVNSPARLAALLAQVGHESGSLRYTSEIWGPTPVQARYEGRSDLGNTEPGDGSRYRGRGLIQTTGRHNYRAVTRRLRERLGDQVPDFEAEPGALEQPRWAVWSALDYWGWRGLNALADVGQFEKITRRINGGLNGQADRLARHRRALAALEGDPEMLPAFLKLALPSIVASIPSLGKIFGSGSEVAERNVKAAELVLEIVQGATGARNAQDAVETLKADPDAVVAATKAVEARWHDLAVLTEVGGGIAAARSANNAPGQTPPSRNMALWITAGLLPLVYMTVSAVLFGDDWPTEIRAMVVATVVSGLLGAITGFWLGSSFGSQRKDDRAAQADR